MTRLQNSTLAILLELRHTLHTRQKVLVNQVPVPACLYNGTSTNDDKDGGDCERDRK